MGAASMRVYLTGGLRIEGGATVIDHRALGGPHAQLVLAYLVCERGRPVARTEIVDLLAKSAAAAIDTDVLLARLGDALRAHLPATDLQSTTATVELTLPKDSWVDVEAAADAIHEAESAVRTGRVPDAFGPSAIAHHIARRPFLPGEHGSWVEAHRERLRSILVRALDARGEVFLSNNEASLAIEAAREVVKLEPYRETGHRLLMRALAASGNTAEALRAYERCVQTLREGLAIEPSEQTRRVFEALVPSSTSSTPSRPITAASRQPPTAPSGDLTAFVQQTLGDGYVLERELTGGMSKVWVATERALDRRVVIKVLPPHMAEMVAADRFAREVRLAARLQHPNIVPVLSVGVLKGTPSLPYYTMPYVSGESLRAALSATPRFAVARVVLILRDVARALAFAHDGGIIHRDIKPENILLAGDAAVVTDFGIAKAVAETGMATAAQTGDILTVVGQRMGTPQYMAPEQFVADPFIDHRADIYSFGVVAYELLTGRRPVADYDLRQGFAARVATRPPNVRELRPDVPATLAALVMKCIEARPDARAQRMTDIISQLEASESRPPRFGGLLKKIRLRPPKE